MSKNNWGGKIETKYLMVEYAHKNAKKQLLKRIKVFNVSYNVQSNI